MTRWDRVGSVRRDAERSALGATDAMMVPFEIITFWIEIAI